MSSGSHSVTPPRDIVVGGRPPAKHRPRVITSRDPSPNPKEKTEANTASDLQFDMEM